VKVEIQAGSTMPDNDQTRMQKLMGFIEAVTKMGFTQYLDPDAVMDELIEAFGVRDENLTAKKDTPIEESKILQSGLFFAPRMSDDHEAHLMIHERESKGTDEEHVHMMLHRMFQKQSEKMQQVQQTLAMKRMQPQVGGQSFMNDMQAQVGALPQPTMPGMPGQVGPQLPAQPVGQGV
jgi:hypothetical protein